MSEYSGVQPTRRPSIGLTLALLVLENFLMTSRIGMMSRMVGMVVRKQAILAAGDAEGLHRAVEADGLIGRLDRADDDVFSAEFLDFAFGLSG